MMKGNRENLEGRPNPVSHMPKCMVSDELQEAKLQITDDLRRYSETLTVYTVAVEHVSDGHVRSAMGATVIKDRKRESDALKGAIARLVSLLVINDGETEAALAMDRILAQGTVLARLAGGAR